MDGRIAELDELEDVLQRTLDRIGELRAGPRVESDAFLADAFMREHTEYEEFSAFRADAPVDLDVPLDERTSIDRDRLDEYVRDVTEFESWESMQTTAAQEEIVDQLVSNTA